MVPPASHRVTRVRWYSGFTPQSLNFVYRTFTFSGVPFQASSTILPLLVECPQPQKQAPGLGSSHFARRYFGNRCFLLFLSLLRCFSSGGSPPYVMYWRMDTTKWWVSPFRDLRINGYLLLPEAFRSLSRLSSALSAKASTLRSSSFDLFIRMRLRMGLKMISHLAVQCVYIVVLIRYL